MHRKIFWISFAKPGQHLGVAIVEVNEVEALFEKTRLPAGALPGAEWLGAALAKAWRLQINPGGGVRAWEVPYDPEMPLNRLLTPAEVQQYGGRDDNKEEDDATPDDDSG